MSTIRSGRASGCRARSSATFVSGPVGTSVTAPLRARICSARKSAACCPSGSRLGGGRSGPSSPVSPWTYAATCGSRTSGAAAPAATGTSSRPTKSRTRIAFAVVFAQRLVAGDRRNAEHLQLGRREREQQRDRVVVPGIAVEQDRRRHQRREYRVHLVRRRQRRLRAEARGRDRARSAGTAQRLRPLAPLEQRDDERRRERIAGRRPVDRRDLRRRRARDLLPVLEEDGALGAQRQRDEPALRPDRARARSGSPRRDRPRPSNRRAGAALTHSQSALARACAIAPSGISS